MRGVVTDGAGKRHREASFVRASPDLRPASTRAARPSPRADSRISFTFPSSKCSRIYMMVYQLRRVLHRGTSIRTDAPEWCEAWEPYWSYTVLHAGYEHG